MSCNICVKLILLNFINCSLFSKRILVDWKKNNSKEIINIQRQPKKKEKIFQTTKEEHFWKIIVCQWMPQNYFRRWEAWCGDWPYANTTIQTAVILATCLISGRYPVVVVVVASVKKYQNELTIKCSCAFFFSWLYCGMKLTL